MTSSSCWHSIWWWHFLVLFLPLLFLSLFLLSVLKMILILLLGDEGERNACFTDQKQHIALEQNCLSVLYHQSLWLYPSPPPLRLLWFWGWWQQDRHHYLNTKKHREEALILELWCADTQTNYLETHGLPRACTSAFTYSFIHKYLLSFHYPWILGIVSASAGALLQSILSSVFRMILLKPISHSPSPNLLSPLRVKAWLPYNGPIHCPQSSLWPISF